MVLAGGPIIKVGHFEADGAEVDLDLGFVPDYIRLINANATGTEQMVLEWFHECAAGTGFKVLVAGDMSWDATGHYVTELDESTISEGVDDDDDDSTRITAAKGVTINTAWMDDSDEVWYIAFGNANEEDHGDINA